MTDRLQGHVAIVTGSTGLGLGTDIARAFAAEGAAVIVTGRDVDRGAHVERSIRTVTPHVHFVAADLSSEGACASLVAETVERFGSLSVLVNNAVAGQRTDAPVAELATEVWERSLLVNL